MRGGRVERAVRWLEGLAAREKRAGVISVAGVRWRRDGGVAFEEAGPEEGEKRVQGDNVVERCREEGSRANRET